MTEPITPSVPRLTRASLCRLRESGALSAPAWEEALNYLDFRPGARAWGDFWRHVLLLCGVLFLAAGVIFFIAWNWADMHRFSRLALVQGIVALTALAAVRLGPDSTAGRLSLLVCGICVGPMLAVFGQTYQTGAELWELFRVWAGVLLLLALAGCQAALWLTAWIVGSLFVLLYLGRTFSAPEEMLLLFGLLPEYVLAQALALALWEAAAYLTRGNARHAWLHVRWLPRLFFFALTANLTVALFGRIAFGDYHRGFLDVMLYLPSEPVFWGLYIACLAGAWLWYRRRQPDLFMLACGVCGLAALFVALLLRTRIFFREPVFALFAWGMILIGLTWAVGKVLIHLQRSMEGEFGDSENRAEEKAPFFSVLARKREWPDLWARLRSLELAAEEAAAPLPQATSSPWYVQAMLAFGGWVAALLLILFLGLFLYLPLNFRDNFQGPLLVGSFILLAVAAVCSHSPSFFARRFGFAAALAGAGGAGAALCMLADSPQHWALLLSLPLACSVPFIRSASYRFLAAVCLAALLPIWLGSMAYGYGNWGWRHRSVEGILNVYVCLALSAVWWVALCGAVAVAFTREANWRHDAKHVELLPPLLFGAYAGLLVFLIFAFSLRIEGGAIGVPLFLSPAPAGLGAGAGFVCLVWNLTRHMQGGSWRIAFLALSALSLPLGWYLPGVGAAVFGMGLARYLASPVLLGSTGFFLFAYMVYYYYYLGLTLLQKSLTLAAVGFILLAAGLGVKTLTNGFAAQNGASGEAGHA